MAEKIPVGATIARSYEFAFGNFLNNLGATWIVQVVILATGYYLTPTYSAAVLRMQTAPAASAGAGAALQRLQNVSAAGPTLLLMAAITIVGLSAIGAAITRQALDKTERPTYLQFPLGADTWRMLGAFLLVLVSFIVLYIGVVLVSVIIATIPIAVAASSGAGGKAVAALFALLVAIAAYGAFIYVSVRMSFLVAPAVIAEGRIAILQAWRLTRGNFWRIIAIGLAIWIPVFVIYAVLMGFAMSSLSLPPAHQGMTPAEIQAWSQQLNTRLIGFSETYRRLWYITYPIALVVSTTVYGLMYGLSAFAYRALAHIGGAKPEDAFS